MSLPNIAGAKMPFIQQSKIWCIMLSSFYPIMSFYASNCQVTNLPAWTMLEPNKHLMNNDIFIASNNFFIYMKLPSQLKIQVVSFSKTMLVQKIHVSNSKNKNMVDNEFLILSKRVILMYEIVNLG